MVMGTFVDDTSDRDDEVTWTLDALASLADQAGLAIGRLRLLATAVHAASHDHLTGLAGRKLFNDRVERALADNRRNGRLTAVGFVDLDGFKQVNDTSGHAAGDAVLVEVAAILRGALRRTDSVARMAGDEFAVLLRDLPDVEAAVPILEGLTDRLRRVYEFGDDRHRLRASIGVALSPPHRATPDALLQAADAAMYSAKGQGGAYRFAEPAVLTT